MVARLVQKGLVRREINPKDKRARELYQTVLGEKASKEVTAIIQTAPAMKLADLDDDEKKTFLQPLLKAPDAANHQSRAPLRTGK